MIRICNLKIFSSFLFQNHFFSLVLTIFITLLSQVSIAQFELGVRDVVIADMKTIRSLFGLPYKPDMIDAISIGDIERVNYLIESGEKDVNARYRRDNTALMWAAWVGNLDIVKLLVEAKAELDLQNRIGYTALIKAVWMGRQDVVEFLISVGVKLDMQDDAGKTALMWAAWIGHWGIVRALVNAGANISIPDDNGATAVMFAVSEDHTYIANYLIKAGAEVGVRGLRSWVCRDFSLWCY